MRYFLTVSLVPLLSFLAVAAPTAPIVTPVPLYPGQCTGFPNWQRSPDDITGSFYLTLDQVDDSSLNGLRNSISAITGPGGQGSRVTFTTERDLALPVMACKKGVVAENYGSAPSPVTFEGIGTSYQAYYSTAGVNLQIYTHEIGGVQQDGTFIGVNNITTWGLTLQSGTIENTYDYYTARLLGPDSGPLGAREVTGFVKPVGL
ncbi:hypothetical protein BT63DRAFT_209344 [Microthyrium microscopicum]|uniref:Uncharacterized protein n=1 Tax=Microthyrium microscopicum TaxID=703497 RepID=A0A6A6UHH2_9PEZI|nr:hypothetical protein BT63DRAFT_209344 [Microthyrium microscopicum]